MTERPLIRAAILAHQGGWDEILLIAGPIVLIVGVLAVVKRRVDASFDDREPATDQPSTIDETNETDEIDDVNRR